MEFKEILDKQRALYLDDLLEFYQEHPSGARELMIELNKEEANLAFRLYRIDHYEEKEGEPFATDLNPDRYLDFDPVEYLVGDMTIELNPFYWNGCEFILETSLPDFDWLAEWTLNWIDEASERTEDKNGLSAVIHNVTKPEITEGGLSFSVDFGSAETTAFLELIRLIQSQGVKQLRIGSFFGPENETDP